MSKESTFIPLISEEMLKKARAKGKALQEKQEAKKKNVSIPKNESINEKDKPVNEPKMSLKDQLSQAMKDAKSASALRDTLQDAKECQAEPEIVKGFADLVAQAKEMAIYKLLLIMPESKAEESWTKLSWREKIELLNEWAEDDSSLQGLLSNLSRFDGNKPLLAMLCRTVERFEQPLRGVETMEDLKKFLDETTKEGLTDCISNASYGKEKGVIVLLEGGRSLLYLPKKEMSVARSGWVFVQEAQARAQKDWEKMNGIKSQATRGLTPHKISKGMDGKLFVQLNPTQGVLLEAFGLGGYTHVRFIDQIGLNKDQIPDNEPQLWDEQYSHIATPPNGALSDAWYAISTAVRELNQQHKREANARYKEREERFSPLTSIATLSSHYEDRGLTRIFSGECGSIAICNDRFRFGHPSQKVGYFGVVIEQKGEKLYLKAVVADPKFDFDVKEWVGEELPFEVNLETSRVDIKKDQPEMEKGKYDSLRMIKTACFLHLGNEVRYASSGEKPENSNALS